MLNYDFNTSLVIAWGKVPSLRLVGSSVNSFFLNTGRALFQVAKAVNFEGVWVVLLTPATFHASWVLPVTFHASWVTEYCKHRLLQNECGF